jgi:hypothetical protein
VRRSALRRAHLIVWTTLFWSLTSYPIASAVQSSSARPPTVPYRATRATLSTLETPGAKLWAKRYNGPANASDRATSLGVSPDGTRVFVTGESTGSSGTDYATNAYDASTGSKLWAKRYNGPANGDDIANSLAVSPDGTEVLVTGWSNTGSPYVGDYATVAYDALTGARLWVARYNGPGNDDDQAHSLTVSPDGTDVFVTGYSNGSSSGADYATIAYDAATGARQWVVRYNDPIDSGDDAHSVGVSPDGTRVFVTGESYGPSLATDYATIAYDAATGAKLWLKRYNGPEDRYDQAFALGVSPDGASVFVTGGSSGPTTSNDFATVAYDASSGAEQWVKRYTGLGGGGDDGATALGVSPDGTKVFVTGYSVGASGAVDYATVGYSASSGAKLWAKRYDGSGKNDDDATSLGVSPDGTTVFVTGESASSGTGQEYATVAYNASTGAKLWVATYHGPGTAGSSAFALGVAPEGASVFVTGRSSGSTSGYDYATVAYGTT